MLTDKQKMDLENLYNFYSLQRAYDSELSAEWYAKMWALQTAVSIFGYEFEINQIEEKSGVEYFSFKLVEIGKWVAFIDKQIEVRSHSLKNKEKKNDT